MDGLLILVDNNDNEIGLMEKLSVHKEGKLHRAFSIFIFNSKEQLLLQQRADDKYHSSGLWTNTCCSHPVNSEPINVTVKKRLMEEMGINCDTDFQFSFIYKTGFENGLIEHEFDHVYFGKSDDLPILNMHEAKGWKYMNLEKLQKSIFKNPEKYSEWLKVCLPEVIKKVAKNKETKL